MPVLDCSVAASHAGHKFKAASLFSHYSSKLVAIAQLHQLDFVPRAAAHDNVESAKRVMAI